MFSNVDLRVELGAIRAETPVAHSRADYIIPYSCSEELAARIPGARLISAESDNHMLLADEPAWPDFARELRAFLA